jgi:outer membrane protein assembly factor BamA
MSAFLDEAYGFLPMVIPITEPAVGFGAGAALMFIDKPMADAQAGFGNPNITVAGGLATENGTWGLFAGDIRYWLDDRLQTKAGLINASVNLDYFGNGTGGKSLSYNLDILGGRVNAMYRLGNSRSWAGMGYSLSSTTVTFDQPTFTQVPVFKKESRVGGVSPAFGYDSRNTIFTPTEGSFLDAKVGVFSTVLGGDYDYQNLGLIGIHYFPLYPRWTLGVRGETNVTFGSLPFFMRPSISMRGVPAMRYQGDYAAQIETELRWQFWERFSMVGFVGTGITWSTFDRIHDSQNSVVAGGTGVRYELARKYGLHMGVDVAFSRDTQAVYLQFGSAWMGL